MNRREAMKARMSNRELDAYLKGLSHAYADVFKAFAKAFEEGEDIHWLRAHIDAQWDDVRASHIQVAL